MTPYRDHPGRGASHRFLQEGVRGNRGDARTARAGREDRARRDQRSATGTSCLPTRDPEMGHLSPQSVGGSSVSLMIYLENVDEVFKRAVAGGAKVKQPVEDKFYGDRSGSVERPVRTSLAHLDAHRRRAPRRDGEAGRGLHVEVAAARLRPQGGSLASPESRPAREPGQDTGIQGGDSTRTLVTYRGAVYPVAVRPHGPHERVVLRRQVRRGDLAALRRPRAHARRACATRSSGMAGVEQHIEYKRELFPGDVVTVTSTVLEVKDKAIRFAHEMRNDETGEVAAKTVLVAVHLDAVTRKARRPAGRRKRPGTGDNMRSAVLTSGSRPSRMRTFNSTTRSSRPGIDAPRRNCSPSSSASPGPSPEWGLSALSM